MVKLIGVSTDAKHKEVYHTDRSCPYLSSNNRPVAEHEIDYHDLRECNHCSEDVSWRSNEDRDMSYYEAAVNAGKKRQ
jgi:hypothetical protein